MTRRPRIGLYSDAATIGGAERAALHLAGAYRGEAEILVCSPVTPILEEAARMVPAVATRLIPSRPAGVAAWIDHRRAFRDLDLDILQVTLSNPFTARPAILAGLSLGVPTVAVEQLVFASRRRRGSLVKHLVSRPLAAHVTVGTASAHELHRLFHLRERDVDIVHNGVPVWDGVPTPYPRRPVIGCAARLEPQKGLDTLVEAMVELGDARLVLLGDGSLRDALAARALALGVADRVEVAGWVDDASPHIAGWDVFVLPSREEAFPLAVVEAMLSSTPVVATDVGSVSDAIVHDETGLLVPVGDAGALASAVRRVLSDAELRHRLVDAARRRAMDRFTVDRMAERYDAIWGRILRSRRAASAGTLRM